MTYDKMDHILFIHTYDIIYISLNLYIHKNTHPTSLDVYVYIYIYIILEFYI